MKRGKYEHGYSKKALALLVAVVLVIGCAIGGTLAWLMDTTDPVTNTFTPANIKITLTETNNTDTNGDGENDAWTAHLVPGETYTKDPEVGVDSEKTDIDCYLFVRMVKGGNPDTYLTYTSLLNEGNGWKQVPEATDVWYRVVKASDETKSWNLIDEDTVTVKDTLTKENMPSEAVSLSYEAYAVQYAGFEEKVKQAWTVAYAQKTN